jgi:preprotein translocase subunit SecY
MDKLLRIWSYKDLRWKIILTLVLLLATRVLAHIPLPGVNLLALQSFFEKNQIFGLLNMFSGGSMSNFSIILMGVGPYITASIIFQLLGMVIPKLEEMQKEGESGQQKIIQYTRLLTIPLAIIQAYSMLLLLKNQQIIPDWTLSQLLVMLVVVTAGTVLLMWIGEIITEKGVGNGLSLIITTGILAGLPTQFRNTLSVLSVGSTGRIMGVLAVAAIAGGVIAVIVYINEGQRNLRVTYARKARMGQTMMSGVDTSLPIRVNTAGVIPIIFAMSIMIFPGVLGKFFQSAKSAWLASFATHVVNFFNNQFYYGIMYFVLVFAFTYFYTGVVFHPDRVAENLQKQGGFIPGLRPGTETANYLKKVISRITFAGALFLALIAILPLILQSVTKITTLTIGGTGVLIIVAVILETYRQILSQLSIHTYDHY